MAMKWRTVERVRGSNLGLDDDDRVFKVVSYPMLAHWCDQVRKALRWRRTRKERAEKRRQKIILDRFYAEMIEMGYVRRHGEWLSPADQQRLEVD
jgi:hypothetical protein